MSVTLSTAILSARQLVGDGPQDNLVRLEDLNNPDIGNAINGTNQVFALTNYPVVPGGVQTVVVDGVTLSGGYTVNEPAGEITFVIAPTISAQVTYYYYLMPDNVWTEFWATALEKLNASTGNPASDVPLVPETLLPAGKQYACAAWAMRLSGQTSLWYDQHLQERDERRENISRKFLQLAQEFNKQGDQLRDEFYKGSGTQNRPAFRIVQHIPNVWTPSR